MSSNESRQSGIRGLLGFYLMQVLIVCTGLGWTTYRYETLTQQQTPPAFRNEPQLMGPLYDVPEIIDDEQLVRVLAKLQPRLRGPRPNMNHVEHALRFWGVESRFDDPQCLSGVEMRDLLLDHRQFSQAWGTETQPFLIPTEGGIRIRTQQGIGSTSHVDHTLASVAEAGVSLDFPVITSAGEKPLRSVLEQSLRDFSLNQLEYEWSALAYALYFIDTNRWTSTEGQEITFDRLAERLMRQRLAQGVCRGNHRLHALVVLLRVDEQTSILSDQGRARIIAHLQDVTKRLVASQHPSGYWEADWPGIEPDGPQSSDDLPDDSLADRLLVTGHVMEWWALAPAELLPPAETLKAAGVWLSDTIDRLSPGQVRAYYTYLTHAGRALSLWRGCAPAEVRLTVELDGK